jgi:hypothetical protein
MSEAKSRGNKGLAARVAGLISIISGGAWIYFWEFIRSRVYEWVAAELPSINSITFDQILHWGLPAALVLLGISLFSMTGPKRADINAEARPGTSRFLKSSIALVAILAIMLVGAVIIVGRDERSLTDREIGHMVDRLAGIHPGSTLVTISCAFDDPRSCEYARRWSAVFDKAGWRRAVITPMEWPYAGVTINVKDPRIDGYYDLISSFDVLSSKPQAHIVPDVAPNVIQIIIGK